ncbi:hypothetical protein AURDEDRAFT_175812 [Auricularia subglabra TFB-10046 SS5]|uniref:Uncharacterized protein n=1 Tax=Auricularia subglabra (strain TFB-10046 / SS5) TaxID=717982 RepID=J0D7M3_AURST|nr:hypothetical protein AURDEDRAFT_175812 [Auricularia subglabra TFB-10046 SS5]
MRQARTRRKGSRAAVQRRSASDRRSPRALWKTAALSRHGAPARRGAFSTAARAGSLASCPPAVRVTRRMGRDAATSAVSSIASTARRGVRKKRRMEMECYESARASYPSARALDHRLRRLPPPWLRGQ